MQVLIVDDSATMRQIMIRCLEQVSGECDLEEAADGAAALEMLSQKRFDLVICDINMPKMDGIQLVRAIRRERDASERVTSAEVAILVVTTEGSSDRVDEALYAGANAHLRKPFTPEQFAERLATLL